MFSDLQQNYFFRQAWNVLATAGIVTLLSAAFILSQTPIYRATATVMSEPAATAAAILSIQSAHFLENIVEKNDMELAVQSGIRTSVAKGFGLISSPKPTRKITTESTVTTLQKHLYVNSTNESQWINIHFDSPDPQLAARIANLVAQTYLSSIAAIANNSQSRPLADEIYEAEKKILEFQTKEPRAELAFNLLEINQSEMKEREVRLESQ